MADQDQKNSNLRRKVFVDPTTQRALAVRMMLHCLCFMIVGGLFAAVGQYLSHPEMDRGDLLSMIAKSFALYALGFLLLMPPLMLDSFKLSNRIVGPIWRLRAVIGQLSRGEKVPPLKFRQGDYWQDIPASFNKLVDKLQEPATADKQAKSPTTQV